MGRVALPARMRARDRPPATAEPRRPRTAPPDAALVAGPGSAEADAAPAWPRYLPLQPTFGAQPVGAGALLDARLDGPMDTRPDARMDARFGAPLLPLYPADAARRAPPRPDEPMVRSTPPEAALPRAAASPAAPSAATPHAPAPAPGPDAAPGTPAAADPPAAARAAPDPAALGAPGARGAARSGAAAARPAGGGGSPAGPARAEGQAAADAEDAQAEGTALPDAVDALADASLQAPPLPWQALDAPWEAPTELPGDALVAAAEPGHPPRPGADAPAAPAAPAPAAAPPAGTNAEDQRRAMREAAGQARQAYAGAADQLRGMHQQLLARANGISHYMAQAHGLQAGEIVQRHDLDGGAIDQAADGAAAATEEAGQMAAMAVDSAALDAGQAIAAAGRSAHGLINAGERSGAARIASVVSGLVSGHVSAYDGAVRQAQEAHQAARRTLTQWNEARATHYSSQRGAWLERAKNEKRQLRIPRWVDPEVKGLQQRFDAKKKAWEQSRDTTACSLSCSYQAALAGENARLATQGRTSVAAALRQARSRLREQQQAAQQALASLTHSQLQQLRTQQRAARSRLNSQARGALSGVRHEAQQAVGGLQAATRGALPTYLRTAQGLEQNLRASAARGAPALRQAAERAPEGALQGARASSGRLDQRLQANQQRLDDSLAEQAGAQLQRSGQEASGLQATLAQLQAQGAAQRAQSAAGVTEAFGGLAGTVTQAAQSWAQPLTVRMAGFIAQQRAQAASALASLRSDAPAATPAPPPPAADSGGPPAAPAPDCGHCASAGGGGGGGAAASGPAPGLDRQVREEVDYNTARNEPATYFASQLEAAGAETQTALEGRANRVVGALGGGFAGTVDESGVLAALRGMTLAQGRALDTQVYPSHIGGPHLDTDLRRELGADSTDYEAASAYLYGDNVTGARLELADSLGTFNDDEARIEEVMRALSPDQLATLGRPDDGTMAAVRNALGGTDREVFDALARGEHATADALRLRDAVDEARVDGNADAVHSAIERYTGAPPDGDWRAAQEMDGDTRREAVVKALGGIVTDAAVARGVAPDTDVRGLSAEDRAVAYVSRDIDVYVGGAGPEGEPQMVTRRLEGANRDLAGALLRHGESSVEARAARLGVEMQRSGDPPNAINIDRATFDPRFRADLANASPAEREAHRRAAEERARVVMLAAERYASGPATPEDFAPAHDPANPAAAMDDTRVTAARDRVIGQLQARFGSDSTGAALAAGLLTDARPSPETAALAMQHAMAGCGTNEDLLFRFTERMDRAEIAAMRRAYQDNTGNSLDADLGTFGHGFLGEVSGDDRLRMERALLGQPRNDRERLEVAAFAIQQQRNEASGFGAWLADGTRADRAMGVAESRLGALAGGPITFGADGAVNISAASQNFDAKGRYTGTDRDTFAATTATAQAIAETYGRRIDAFADIATTGIAILGAVAAAVITVVTGGAAGPLIAAAIVTGLASMSANYAIKGGRYGWEQAAVDLGMTAVQAVTAGVGAQLGAAAQVASKGAQAASTASRTLASLSRIFTGNPVVDQIIIGTLTGSLGGVANAAFDERTWAHGGDDAIGALFGGLIKGGLSGAATATLTNSIEALGRNGAVIAERARAYAAQGGMARGLVGLAGRGIGGVGRGIDAALNASAQGGMARGAGAMAARGLARGSLSAIGGMGGRATEILVDAGSGRFKGDAGDALLDIGHAGAHAFVQGIGEGAAESVGQAMHGRRLAAAADAIGRERAERGMPPLSPHDVEAAAHDLLFLNRHGRDGGDGLGRALNLDHVVTHGGLTALATPHPVPVVEDHMRAQLLRHVPAELHGNFADVPIRVLPAGEYHALTRSESGPVVTLIHEGRPTVVVREGTPLARLADEGPHLVQAHDATTRARVARLDEAALAHWDTLPVEAQIDLYRNKVELEIDAHERIAQSLQAETTGEGAPAARLAAEVERNEATLRALRQRLQEVEDIGPLRSAAMAEGAEPRPQYLEQPARLFSKDGPRRSTPEEIAAEFQRTVHEQEQRIGRPHDDADADGPHPTLPDEPPQPAEGRPLFDRTAEQLDAMVDRRDRGNTFNTEQEAHHAHNEVYLDTPDGRRVRADSYVPGEEIVSRKHTQLSELGEDAAIAYINELVEKYPPGTRLADVPSNAALLAAGHTALDGRLVLSVPEQHGPVPQAVLEHARRAGVVIRDPEGRIYTPEHPDGIGAPGGPRVSARDPEQHAEAMRRALLRHVPAELHDAVGGVDIVVLSDRAFVQLTGSERGRAVTLIMDGKPMVVVREGTPVARLADEGPHLVQAHEEGTSSLVARHDEAEMQRWHQLPLERQIALYGNKLALEIDAHQRIARSLDAESPQTGAAAARHRADQERNHATLAALHARQAEVQAVAAPQRRAAIEGGTEPRPQYLDQPARLFSKDADGQVRTVFEPFSGPSLDSAHALQARYRNAQMITSEASPGRVPEPVDQAAFHAVGGRFLHERFGASLPDNSVDRMHVRFPLPHAKTVQTMVILPRDLPPGLTLVQSVEAMQQMARQRAAQAESLTNLGPHALRLLSPGGEIEVVYHEREIAHEIAALQRQVWTDPATGERYRLEPVGPVQVRPKSEVAPHSGHGVGLGAHDPVNVCQLRKVRVPGTGTDTTAPQGGTRPTMSPEELDAARAGRSARKQEEKQALRERAKARREAQERAQQQRQAVDERQQGVDTERAERQRALNEGRTTPEQDLQQRVADIAAQIDMPAHVLARAVQGFLDDLGGSGRRLDAQDVIDSLRNRVREGRPPRFGDLEGLVAELVLEQNAEAVAQMREHVAQIKPDAVLGVQRGGAFLAEMLAHGVADFPVIATVPKFTLRRPGMPDAELRTPHLEVQMLERIAAGQRHFALVDFYMGGVFAAELVPMVRRILQQHPQVRIDVLWMRETAGFERLVFHPELEHQPGKPRRNPLIPTREELERGVVFAVRGMQDGRPVLEGPGVVMPPLRGRDAALEGLRVHEFPVELVLGDDMRIVMDAAPDRPIVLFDRAGRIVRTIQPGAPDPLSGLVLDHNTRELLLRLIEEKIRGRAEGQAR
ncbi:hypothetical protein [Pseudorhodoferax sp. Leaf274]|uniref:hypothetical protein n=1 Tax=Pseudorhodoferax sp. Leaf274 TaxID=1736318 RepID=UPI000703730A|nr:hypothetical protein [Pseudorhodoferax sp. Leaf274]KQP37388.1 hypothetical protein ASF44_13585 [Pseudorhodoferax sp. Leaf274]